MSEFQSKKTNQTTNNVNWKDLLEGKVRTITPQIVDYMIENKPDYDVVTELIAPFNVPVKEPKSLAISGVGGIIGALYLFHKYPNIKYLITTPEVLLAEPSSPLYTAKYAIQKLKELKPSLQIVELFPGDYQKIKNLLSEGAIYVSGLPVELVIQISQLAGFGKLYHHSPVQKKIFIY